MGFKIVLEALTHWALIIVKFQEGSIPIIVGQARPSVQRAWI